MTTQHLMTRTFLGPTFSEGARLMWTRVILNGTSQESIRRALGLGRGMVPRFLYGDRRISLEVAVRVQEAFGIEAKLWLAPPTRPFDLTSLLAKLARRAERERRQNRAA